MANEIGSESARIASARLPQFGLQDSAAGQTQVARVTGDTLRNVAQFNSALMQSGFTGLGQLLGSQLQGLQPYQMTGSGRFNQQGNFNTSGWNFGGNAHVPGFAVPIAGGRTAWRPRWAPWLASWPRLQRPVPSPGTACCGGLRQGRLSK